MSKFLLMALNNELLSFLGRQRSSVGYHFWLQNDMPRSVQLFELVSSLPIVGVELNGKLDSSMKVASASVSVLHQQAATDKFSNKYLTCQGRPTVFIGVQ